MEGNPEGKWTSLIHLLNEDFLKVCFQWLKGDAAAGVDGVTVKEYEANLEDNIKDLVARMKAWKYRPQSVRRVYIPKADGSKRPLGIPAVEDKIVQMGIKKILEEIFEDEFLDVSYGFRPNRNCHEALDALDKCVMTKSVNYVVDMDIEKFFDTVDHKWLMVALKQRISDRNLLRLIGRFLKAGVMEEGKYIEVDKGTPQGGIISPVLANIYLHYILDKWFEEKVKTQQKGYAQLIRYADDFVVCFQSGKEAQEFSEALRQRLGRYGLKVSESKSRIIEFGRYAWQRARGHGKKLGTFDFLGFTHYCDRTRKGKFKLGRKTSRKKLWQKVKAMNQWLKKMRNLLPLNEWWKILGVKLIGHYRYYGISGNLQALRVFYIEASKLAYKWINRRSQKKSFTYAQYCRFKENNPLSEPKIYHLTYTLSSVKGSITEEPCVGNPQARFCEGR
jgi:group II intron reverse transcriptase/maturase